MRKILFASIFFVTSFYSMAQQQIPNGDFENWIYYPYCFGLDSVSNFLTGDAFTYLNAKRNTGLETCPGSPNYRGGDDQGGYALSISARYIGNQPHYNFVSLGKAKDFGGIFGISSEGIPFTGRPTKLTGYYKLYTEVDTDKLTIQVVCSNSLGGDSFYGEFSTSANQDFYQKFEIDLVYNLSYPNDPTTLKLIMGVGHAEVNSINENTVAFIDNLVFIYDTPTATVNYTASSPINVYAANKNINFSENVSDVRIVDMVGASKMQEASSTKIVNVASLTTGMYIVTYKHNDAYFSKKVVIE